VKLRGFVLGDPSIAEGGQSPRPFGFVQGRLRRERRDKDGAPTVILRKSKSPASQAGLGTIASKYAVYQTQSV